MVEQSQIDSVGVKFGSQMKDESNISYQMQVASSSTNTDPQIKKKQSKSYNRQEGLERGKLFNSIIARRGLAQCMGSQFTQNDFSEEISKYCGNHFFQPKSSEFVKFRKHCSRKKLQGELDTSLRRPPSVFQSANDGISGLNIDILKEYFGDMQKLFKNSMTANSFSHETIDILNTGFELFKSQDIELQLQQSHLALKYKEQTDVLQSLLLNNSTDFSKVDVTDPQYTLALLCWLQTTYAKKFYQDEFKGSLAASYKFLLDKAEWDTLLQVHINTDNRKRLQEMLTCQIFGKTSELSDKLLYLGMEFKCVQECFAIEAQEAFSMSVDSQGD